MALFFRKYDGTGTTHVAGIKACDKAGINFAGLMGGCSLDVLRMTQLGLDTMVFQDIGNRDPILA
ncbi:MAG: hypothetical protein IKI38_01795, partial [Mogibacterium sp.]|nr:hypothetical protein [Mogibacterium sp.]